ncbi:hypothetical protein GCM10027084_16520 [Pseudoxanthomonas sangjuensis]|uniref:DUF4124 domain-containing protein n=1 Tax=Pseudoxanthomonas sangjuensis TaxID=1503750 RepID=UPI0013917719|nr:DUF4124 domain-containing protein [Pseudoxanthomonas sangjuensis]KAF1709684.1 hypothetical protein CSC71_10595 [Pseudoxanthomonas sangjuensis]
MKANFAIVLCALCALAGTAQAQVFKCQDAAGHVVYQSNRCELAGLSEPAPATAPATPAPAANDAPRRAKVQPDRQDPPDDAPATAGFYYSSAAHGAKAPRYYSVDACSAAKSRRREAFGKLGPQRSEHATRFYDDAVERACGSAR